MDKMKKNNKIISLFSGAGGMDIGFEMSGFQTAVAVEYDKSCCDTLRKNRPKTPVIQGDISKVSTERILEVAGLKPTEAALVIGGPPCQSFSLAGKRMGLNDPRGQLVLEFIRVVRESLPVAFVMENVKGMVNWKNGLAMAAILNEISEPIYYGGQEYEYRISTKVLNAVNYGVPQFRERVFIIGNRLNKNFEFPAPTHSKNNNILTIFEDQKENIKTVWDAIGELPKAEEPSEAALRVSKTIKERIKKHGY